MYGPERILAWLEGHVKSMRRSRRKTLAAVVAAAMRMKGVGVLALGRAMAGVVGAPGALRAALPVEMAPAYSLLPGCFDEA